MIAASFTAPGSARPASAICSSTTIGRWTMYVQYDASDTNRIHGVGRETPRMHPPTNAVTPVTASAPAAALAAHGGAVPAVDPSSAGTSATISASDAIVAAPARRAS